MNPTSLYVSTSQIVFQHESGDQNLSDLYRLIPYLRQALSCTVCGSLLIDPHTPKETECQHHVCRKCLGGRKNLKPSCSWCRDYQKYEGNAQLRILMQCYKNLCEYIITKPMYNSMSNQLLISGMANGTSSISTSLSELIDEGARFQDNYQSNSGHLKSAYSMLPCVYTNNSVTQTVQNISITTITNKTTEVNEPHAPVVVSNNAPIKTVSNGSALYSVMYAGTGNKITIKRSKVEDDTGKAVRSVSGSSSGTNNSSSSSCSSSSSSSSININRNSNNAIRITSASSISTGNSAIDSRNISKDLSGIVHFKKPASSRSKTVQKRKGCRCGNATPTPGKLTCCGQRCPCYVESKSCVDCRCRGCRNPHRADGFKIRPHIPELDRIEIINPDGTTSQTNCIELPAMNSFSTTPTNESNRLMHQLQDGPDISVDGDSIVFNPNNIDDDIRVVYTTHLPAILMQENPAHVSSIPSPSMSTSIFNDKQQDMFQHDTIHSIFGEEILASGPFSDGGCSSEAGDVDHSDVEIDI
ncbi:E3 ubiquitin-protein ligase MSL2 [Pseudolycoriella hygida]|uniref:E3 ubiquitin-protein ligase MSL2 n=1 Tax=Pseudolycoriella hygida TaxID=35572 RepID=A0A9Q0NEX8_9DIPT|nr:E3 ubiquitin-protein ligase MSL2 [Pseudolycoriella hygida]